VLLTIFYFHICVGNAFQVHINSIFRARVVLCKRSSLSRPALIKLNAAAHCSISQVRWGINFVSLYVFDGLLGPISGQQGCHKTCGLPWYAAGGNKHFSNRVRNTRMTFRNYPMHHSLRLEQRGSISRPCQEYGRCLSFAACDLFLKFLSLEESLQPAFVCSGDVKVHAGHRACGKCTT